MTHATRPDDRREGAAFPACPSCGAPQGEPCTGSWTCRSRIEAAGNTTCRFHGIVPEGHDCLTAAKAFEAAWPDGGIYANRHGETVLTADEARTTAQATGGTWRAAGNGETPLDGLDEKVVFDGAHWIAEGPRGALWIIRWSSAGGAVAAWKHPRGRTGSEAKAGDLPAARREAARIAAAIADGKTKES